MQFANKHSLVQFDPGHIHCDSVKLCDSTFQLWEE